MVNMIMNLKHIFVQMIANSNQYIFTNRKNEIMKKRSTLIGILVFVLMVMSCQKEESLKISKQDETSTEISAEISAEVLQKLQSMYINTDGVSISSMELPDGSKLDGYLVENDIFIPFSQFNDMELPECTNEKQYHAYNTVSAPRTINIMGYTAIFYGLTPKMKTSLQWAVNNFNNLGLDLYFNLTYGTDYTDQDILVYQSSVPYPGGLSGYPQSGDPYKWIQIYSGSEEYSYNLIEGLITHEIGHSIGFRHTDWFNRQSCGGLYDPEIELPLGAVLIPGTPYYFDSSSIMNACVPSDTYGEFSSYDVVALEYLY